MTQNYLSEACMEQCAKMGFILWLFLFSILYYPCPPSFGIQALLYSLRSSLIEGTNLHVEQELQTPLTLLTPTPMLNYQTAQLQTVS